MKKLIMAAAAALTLAGCANEPSPAASAMPGPTPGPAPASTAGGSSFSAAPPANPTGAQGYQSPNTPAQMRPPGGM